MKPPREPYPPDVDEEAEPPDGPADVVDAIVEDADWANTKAVRASLVRVELRRCRLTGAELSEGTLKDVVLSECRLDLSSFRYARLERVAFRDCRLEECDLLGATLRDVVFERCDLRGAVLHDATVERVQLERCELLGLQGVEALRGARLAWNDVVENGPLFAAALGIEILPD